MIDVRRPESVVPFTLFAASILPFLDAGKILDIGQTRAHIADGSTVDWLVGELGPAYAAEASNSVQHEEVAHTFAELDERAGPDWNVGVDKNGLCLLLAYAVEACRQGNLEQRWSDY